MYISGLISGIDSDLIDRLMAIERRPIVQMQARKDVLAKQRDAWRDINMRLNTMRERVAELRDEAVFFGRLATSTNEAAVKISAASGAAEGNYVIDVIQLAKAHRVQSGELNSSEAFGDVFADWADGTITINDVDIDVTEADTLRTLAAKINGADAGVTATVIDRRLVLRADETGVDGAIEVEDGDGILTKLGLLNSDGSLNELNQAQDAIFTVEGVEVTRSSNTVDDLFDGVTFTLVGQGESIVTIERDYDGTVDKVKAFVDQFNSVQSFMASVAKASPDAASRGVLSGDGLLMRIQSQLRNGVMGAVTDDPTMPYGTLMSVGIKIDRYGTMTLDETKLRDALADDPEAVHRLFGAVKPEDDSEPGFDGVAVRLEAAFQGWLRADDGVLAERQKLFGTQMRSIDESIERFERRLEIREQTLMRQFTALETVLATFQSQAMWLEGQLNQLSALTSAGSRGR